MLEFILDFFYPPVCGFCGKLNKNHICPKCNLNIKKLMKINKIKYKDKFFDELIYLFKYDGIIREKILDFKFNNKSYLYKMLSKLIVKNKKICGIIEKYDIIIPVPMHKEKKKKRGYNQTELIAREIATNIENIDLDIESLVKKNNITTQSLLKRIERQKNVLGAYCVKNNNNISEKNILLLDDIYTTGSTVNECSKMLKRAGANKVGVLVIAKD